MKIPSLEKLLEEELKDLYSAESQLVKALPKMANAASSSDLQDAFTSHLEETKGHVERLQQVGQLLEIKLTGKKCKAMEGLIEEGKELMEEGLEPSVLDAALIAAAQKVEHYEIASYGSVRTWAEETGHQDVAKLVQATLDEEAAADKKLTALAKNVVNAQAA